MPHKRLSPLLRHLPKQKAKDLVTRQENKLRFYQMPARDEVLSDAPEIFEPDIFRHIRKSEEVGNFIRAFWKWNEKVLWLLSSVSAPYIGLQKRLVDMSCVHLGKEIVDLGCGTGNFLAHLFRQNGRSINKIFAVDIDWPSLTQVPATLQAVGYDRKVALIQSSTMSKLPIWDESVSGVISSLGGLMYSGWWFEEIDGKPRLVAERKEALRHCLADINRILKPDGYLAFSSPKPNPDWKVVRKETIWKLLLGGELSNFLKAVKNARKAEALSAFMHEIESVGRAHYLDVKSWSKYLEEAGFRVDQSSQGECYAGQGVLILAQKVRSL